MVMNIVCQSLFNSVLSSVQFKSSNAAQPYTIAISGPVGSGKSTLAAQLNEKLLTAGIKSAVVSTDNFLLPNVELARKKIFKGFPLSYDIAWIQRFISQITKRQPAIYPCYVHQDYDRLPGVEQQFPTDRQVIIVEGLNAINLKVFDSNIYLLASGDDCIKAITARTLQLFLQYPNAKHPLNQQPLNREKIHLAVLDNWRRINRQSSWLQKPYLSRPIHYITHNQLWVHRYQLVIAVFIRNLYWRARIFLTLSKY